VASYQRCRYASLRSTTSHSGTILPVTCLNHAAILTFATKLVKSHFSVRAPLVWIGSRRDKKIVTMDSSNFPRNTATDRMSTSSIDKQMYVKVNCNVICGHVYSIPDTDTWRRAWHRWWVMLNAKGKKGECINWNYWKCWRPGLFE
jgi:hypothetical protein